DIAQLQPGDSQRLPHIPLDSLAHEQVAADTHVGKDTDWWLVAVVGVTDEQLQGAGGRNDQVVESIGIEVLDEIQAIDATPGKAHDARKQLLWAAEAALLNLPLQHAVTLHQRQHSQGVSCRTAAQIPADAAPGQLQHGIGFAEVETRVRTLEVHRYAGFGNGQQVGQRIVVCVDNHQLPGVGRQAERLRTVAGKRTLCLDRNGPRRDADGGNSQLYQPHHMDSPSGEWDHGIDTSTVMWVE